MQELLEVEILALLKMDHPSIVKFYQVIYDNVYINIVMELVKGIPLSDYIIKHGKVSEEMG